MRSYYSSYAAHCARYYFHLDGRRVDTRRKSNVENYNAVVRALQQFNDTEKDYLRRLYTADYIEAEVYRFKELQHIKPGYFWKLINAFEKAVAKNRGLI